MSYLRSDAEASVQAVGAFHTWHSAKTWNPGQPGIDPWLRDALVSLQQTLQTIAQTQLKIAEQVDLNSQAIQRLARRQN